MTASTEQELYEQWRDDYALTYEPNYDEHLEADCRAAFLAGMLAARRDQVVKWNHVTFQAQGGEAAPVKMPEPVAYLQSRPSSLLRTLEFSKVAVQLSAQGYKSLPLYTEQQVRQLLADHDIK